MGLQEFDDDSEKEGRGASKSFEEFDCPVCNANNPYGDGFRAGDEIRCFYCGSEFRVSIDDGGNIKLKEL